MIRPSLPALALAAVLVAGCDRTSSLVVTPELDSQTSFESGLDGWVVDRGATSTGSGSVASGGASDGNNYVRVTLDQGADFVWLERSYTLEPATAYSVTLSADLRAFSGSADLRVFAGTTDPSGSGFSSEGPVPDDWTRILAPKPVTSDAAGRVWVAVGVAATGQAAEIGIDRLGAVFLRTGGS